MTTLVTGATGLVGFQACAALVSSDEPVRALVREPRPGPLDRLPVEQVRGSLSSPAALDRAMRGCRTVIHCAAVYSYATDSPLSRVNVDGTREVLSAAVAAGVRRAVVVSSSVTCGSSDQPATRSEQHHLGAEPVPAYFESKVAQERAALEIGAGGELEVVIACPTVVLGGPSRRLVPSNAILLRYLLDPTRSTFPGGCNVVGAADVGAGLVVLAERGVPGERYLLGGDNLSWRTLHATIGDLVGVGGPHVELPASATYASSALAELWARLTGAAALSTREEARTVGRYYWYDHAKAKALGYRPGPSRAAIASGLAWLLVDGHVPRWVREALRPADEVRRARPLTPRALAP